MSTADSTPTSSDDEEAAGLAMMRDAGDAIVAGIDRLASAWVVASVARIVDAWGRLEPSDREAALARAQERGSAAGSEVAEQLRAFFACDPSEQRTTPLEIVRTLRRTPTEILAAVGIPPVERDEYETKLFPDDVYGLVPRSLADFGDEDLAPMLMVWGLGKAKVQRARAAEPTGGEAQPGATQK
jgi:hypothetical protein